MKSILYTLGGSDIQEQNGEDRVDGSARFPRHFRAITRDLVEQLTQHPERLEWSGPSFTAELRSLDTVKTFDLPLLRCLTEGFDAEPRRWHLFLTDQTPEDPGDTVHAGEVVRHWLAHHRPQDEVLTSTAVGDPSDPMQMIEEVGRWVAGIQLQACTRVVVGPGTPAMREALSLHTRRHLITHGGLYSRRKRGDPERPTEFVPYIPAPILELDPLIQALEDWRIEDAHVQAQRLDASGWPQILAELAPLAAVLYFRVTFRPIEALAAAQGLSKELGKDNRKDLDPLRRCAHEASFESDFTRFGSPSFAGSLDARRYLRFEMLEALAIAHASKDFAHYVALAKTLAENLTIDLADLLLQQMDVSNAKQRLAQCLGEGSWIRPIEVWRWVSKEKSFRATLDRIPQVWKRRGGRTYQEHFTSAPDSLGRLRNRSFLGHGARGVTAKEVAVAERKLPYHDLSPGCAHAMLLELAEAVHGPDPRSATLTTIRQRALEILSAPRPPG